MFKRITCLVMSIFLILGATACKKKKEPEIPSMRYVEEEIGKVNELDMPGMMAVNSQGQAIIQNTASEKPEYLVLGQDGKPVKSIVCDIEGQSRVFTLDSQDNIYIVSIIPDENLLQHNIHIADPQGNIKKTIELDKTDQNTDSYNNTITGITVDNDGNIILTRMKDNILFLDKDGNEKGTFGEVIYKGTVQADSDNNVIVYGTRISDYKSVLQKFDPATGKNLWTTIFEPRREEGISIGEGNIIRSDPKDGYIYLLTGDAIEKFDSKGEHIGKELDFKEQTVLASGLQPKDNLWLLAVEPQLSSIPKTEANPDYLPEFSLYRYALKEITEADLVPINISVPSSSRLLDVAISKFNKANPGYKMIVKEAGTGKRKEYYDEKYINTLNTELMSGLGPDIISVATLPYEKYISKNVLADLTQMMETDSLFSGEAFYDNILNGMKVNDRLYAMPVSFLINALVSGKKILSDRGITVNPESWTWEDFNKIADGTSSSSGVYTVPPNTGYVLLSGSYGRFIDITEKKASFDSGEFEKMLMLAKRLGMDNNKVTSDGVSPLFEAALRGTVVFSPQVIGELIMLSTTKVLLGGEIELFNLPGADEGTRGGSFSIAEAYAISSNSKHREKAWEFVKILLSEEVQSLDEMKGFPVVKNALKGKIGKNNELLSSDSMTYSVTTGIGEPVTPVILTENEISQFLEFIDGLQTYCHMDNKILEMIQKEAESFFAGKKTASEAAKTIQQKANTYLNE